jgi:hypothetical protein
VTGPEHYEEAERWIAEADERQLPEAGMECLALAQVHATLALAAATAMAGVADMPTWDADKWETAAGTLRSPSFDPNEVPEP